MLAWVFRNNIYKKRFIKALEPNEYTDIIQAHKVLTKGSNAKEQYELYCKTLCRNPTLAKCGGEAQHLEKVRIWSPPGLPNV